jgi:hypothetical protein
MSIIKLNSNFEDLTSSEYSEVTRSVLDREFNLFVYGVFKRGPTSPAINGK